MMCSCTYIATVLNDSKSEAGNNNGDTDAMLGEAPEISEDKPVEDNADSNTDTSKDDASKVYTV